MGKVSFVLRYESIAEWEFQTKSFSYNTYVLYFNYPIVSQQKNHTARNQSSKAHRNGIKKARDYPAKSQKGVSINMIYLVVFF